MVIARHCERSEAIHGTSATKMDCFAALAMTGQHARRLSSSIPDVHLHMPAVSTGNTRITTAPVNSPQRRLLTHAHAAMPIQPGGVAAGSWVCGHRSPVADVVVGSVAAPWPHCCSTNWNLSLTP